MRARTAQPPQPHHHHPTQALTHTPNRAATRATTTHITRLALHPTPPYTPPHPQIQALKAALDGRQSVLRRSRDELAAATEVWQQAKRSAADAMEEAEKFYVTNNEEK